MKTLRPRLNTIISGFLLVISFPPWNLSLIAWVCLTPWLIEIKKARSYRHILIQSTWLSILMTVGGYYWVAYAVQRFGKLPWAIGIVMVFIFGLFNQIQFTAFAALSKYLDRNFWKSFQGFGFGLVVSSLVLATLYSGVDWLIPKLFQDTLAHSQYNLPWIRQLADVGGVSTLTWAIVFINLICSGLWLDRFRFFGTSSSGKQLLAVVVSTFIILGHILAYGYYRNKIVTDAILSPQNEVNFAMIQANIGDFEKVAAKQGIGDAASHIVATFLNMSRDALQHEPRPDVIVWPETAYPSTFSKSVGRWDRNRELAVYAFSKNNRVSMIFGGYDRNGFQDFNSIFFLEPTGHLSIYHKAILLPFGEYVPFLEHNQTFRKMFPQMGFFGRGPGPSIHSLGIFGPDDTSNEPRFTLETSPIVCYEALLPNYTLGGARKGSELILNVTNDSWFGPWGEPHLHLALTVFRSIETRLPQVRATNTGISTLILPNGEMVNKSHIGESEVVHVQAPIIKPIRTLTKAIGIWFGPLCAILSLLLMAYACIQARRRV